MGIDEETANGAEVNGGRLERVGQFLDDPARRLDVGEDVGVSGLKSFALEGQDRLGFATCLRVDQHDWHAERSGDRVHAGFDGSKDLVDPSISAGQEIHPASTRTQFVGFGPPRKRTHRRDVDIETITDQSEQRAHSRERNSGAAAHTCSDREVGGGGDDEPSEVGGVLDRDPNGGLHVLKRVATVDTDSGGWDESCTVDRCAGSERKRLQSGGAPSGDTGA